MSTIKTKTNALAIAKDTNAGRFIRLPRYLRSNTVQSLRDALALQLHLMRFENLINRGT